MTCPTLRVSVSWQPPEVPAGPQGSWSCSAPSRWSKWESRKNFPQALSLERLGPFLRVSKQSPFFTAIEENGGGKRLLQPKLACEADGVAFSDRVKSGHRCHCWGDPGPFFFWAGAILRTFAQRHLKWVKSSNFWPFMLIYMHWCFCCFPWSRHRHVSCGRSS